MRLCSEPFVNIHDHRVETGQRGERREQQDDQTAALNGLNGPGQKVRRQRLEVLQYAHAKCVAEDPLRVLVHAVGDVGGLEEEGEGVGLLGVHEAALHELLDLLGALLPVAADLELVAVAPEHGGARLDAGLGQHVVEVDDLVARLVADDDEHGPLPLPHAILDQRADALVHLLPHPRRRRRSPVLSREWGLGGGTGFS